MATQRQRKLVDKVIENGGNVSRAMVEAGYSEASAKNPQKYINSDGVKELFEEYGLTRELVVTALVDDINAKRKNRTAELKLASDILGLAQPHKLDLTTGGDKINNPFDGLTTAELRKLLKEE